MSVFSRSVWCRSWAAAPRRRKQRPARPRPHFPSSRSTRCPRFRSRSTSSPPTSRPGRGTSPKLFDAGRLLFHTNYNGLDGVGILKRGNGSKVDRFAPTGPRGPGAQSCGGCHGFPVPAAAGLAHTQLSSDPESNDTPPWNARSVISVLGNGAQQLLAQEMTEELHRAARRGRGRGQGGAGHGCQPRAHRQGRRVRLDRGHRERRG